MRVAMASLTLLAAGCAAAQVAAPAYRPAPPPRAKAEAPKPKPKTEPPKPAAEALPAAPRAEPPYSVLFILIDALRADMPWAGYPRNVAPWLNKFAERCTLYPRAYSMSSYTAKSVVPTLAGLYPTEMKRDGYFFTKWSHDNELLSERAQRKGVRTLSGNGHGYFLPQFGVKQGWDDYRLLKGTFLDNKGVADVNSDRLNVLAKEMLSSPANTGEGKQFFAYFHFLDPHYSYIKHDTEPDYGNKRRDVYDNEVHFTDRWVGDLIDWALRQPFGKKLAVVITADHGEGFGERGHFRHAYEVWESLVRVPLFIYVPNAPPQRIEVARGAIDLAPTMAELLGLSTDQYRGHSLVGEVFGEAAEPRPIVVDLPRADLMDKRRAVIDGDYKLVVLGDSAGFLLFNVTDDPSEKRNLAYKQPEKLAEMKRLYRKLSGEIPNVPVEGGAELKGAPPGQRY